MSTSIKTGYGQTIEVGSQVAYATEPKVKQSTLGGETSIEIAHGQIRVATVTEIEQIGVGFAEADPLIRLHLDNGESISSDDAVVTDGRFSYPW